MTSGHRGPNARDQIACYSFHSFLVEVHKNPPEDSSRAKALPVKRSEKGYGDDNDWSVARFEKRRPFYESPEINIDLSYS